MNNNFSIKTRGIWRSLESKMYNYLFNKETGLFIRWGETPSQDAEYSPFGPEIADIEISTSCSQGCAFCYKDNLPTGAYMTLGKFQEVLASLGSNVGQVALGIGDFGAGDMWAIMEHCRSVGIVPNITINGVGLTWHDAVRLTKLCGAVAVSMYDYKTCYRAVRLLRAAGHKQVNVHYMVSNETIAGAFELLKTPLASIANAIVWLIMKPKGRADGSFTVVEQTDYTQLIGACIREGISFGSDSCGAPRMREAIKMLGLDEEKYALYIEPCESGLFSIYVNVNGDVYPCSFAEGIVGSCRDGWTGSDMVEWRERLLSRGRVCSLYNV